MSDVTNEKGDITHITVHMFHEFVVSVLFDRCYLLVHLGMPLAMSDAGRKDAKVRTTREYAITSHVGGSSNTTV